MFPLINKGIRISIGKYSAETTLARVSCNIPGFYQILGEFFFALLEMIGNSQGFKTFESI
jgi:hypothetical protein